MEMDFDPQADRLSEWGITFQEKTNVKINKLKARLPYMRKFHQYILYTAFNEEL